MKMNAIRDTTYCESNKNLNQSTKKSNSALIENYIIQQEVYPPMILNNHKFVIRAHVLLTLDNLKDNLSVHNNVYINKTIICLEYGNEHQQETKTTNDNFDFNNYISSNSKIRSNPKPYVMSGDMYTKLFPQMIDIVSTIHHQIHLKHMIPSIIEYYNCIKINDFCADDETTKIDNFDVSFSKLHYYHLFGYDFMVTKDAKLVLLEVNANPAIASGTMSNVPKEVYHQLLLDVLKIVVFPVTNGATKETGNFLSCIER